MGREDRVLSLIVDGEPNASDMPDAGLLECFPPAMRFRVDAAGTLLTERSEPIAADVRKGKDGRASARLKLLAGVMGVGYDDLRQREQQRQRWQRIQMGIAAAAAAVVAALAYVIAADAGARVPGYQAIQDRVDSREASLSRPVPTDAQIRDAAAALRLTLVQRMEREAEKIIA